MGKEINNRAEIKDIIEKKPHFLIRWGISLFLLMIIIAFIIVFLFHIISFDLIIEKIKHFI